MTRNTEIESDQDDVARDWVYGCDGLLGRGEAATHLDVDPRTITRMIKAGELWAKRFGREVKVCKRSLREYINGMEDIS